VASQNTVFKASDAEISVPVTKLITNDRMSIASAVEFRADDSGNSAETLPLQRWVADKPQIVANINSAPP
jgi:hypothetical protein